MERAREWPRSWREKILQPIFHDTNRGAGGPLFGGVGETWEGRASGVGAGGGESIDFEGSP